MISEGGGVKFVKVLNQLNKAPFTGYSWHVPDGKRKARKMRKMSGNLTMCVRGYHVTDLGCFIFWMNSINDIPWFVEILPPVDTETGAVYRKYLTTQARILSPVPDEELPKDYLAFRNVYRDVMDEVLSISSLMYAETPSQMWDGPGEISIYGAYGKMTDQFSSFRDYLTEQRARKRLVELVENAVSTQAIVMYSPIARQRLFACIKYVILARVQKELGGYIGVRMHNRVADNIMEELREGRVPYKFDTETGEITYIVGELK